MTIYVPWGLIAIAIVLYFTLSTNKKSRLIKRERAETLKSIRQQYLESMMSSSKIDKEDTTIVKDE
jgi:hypothetical protein